MPVGDLPTHGVVAHGARAHGSHPAGGALSVDLPVPAVALAVGEILALASFIVGQALISGKAPSATFGQPNVVRAIIGAGLYLAILGLFGVAVGALLRNAAAAIAVLVAVLFVLPGIAATLPVSIQNTVEMYWPTNAGTQVAFVVRDAHTVSAWSGFALMCLFVAIVLAAAFAVLQRRDA